MNNQLLITEQQETNRVVKGYEIYNNGLTEKLNDRVYIVKGKYEVEDLTTKEDIEPVYICSCPDYRYRQVQCAHITAVQFYQLENGA